MTKNSTTNAARDAGREQHTPGPWTVNATRNACGPALEILHDEDGQGFTVIIGTHTGMDCLANRPANARLIAAAPELLAALQQAQMALAGFVGKGHTPVVINAYCQATAAIAKATGGAR